MEQEPYDVYDALATTTAATATASLDDWTHSELREFLDRHGEDYDHHSCTTENLKKKVRLVEFNTGQTASKATKKARTMASSAEVQEEEIDPLDAFMADIGAMEQDIQGGSKKKKYETTRSRVERFEAEDNVADFLEKKQLKKHKDVDDIHEHDVYVYNEDDEVVGGGGAHHSKDIIATALVPVDHSQRHYEPFRKSFYHPNPEIQSLDINTIHQRRKQLNIHLSFKNTNVAQNSKDDALFCPISSFSKCGLPPPLLRIIKEKAGYTTPTPIQAQALPIILSGADVVGIAQTGSGKTAAFLLPMVVHVMDQRYLEVGEGPIAVIVAPTRELAEQIHREARRFSRLSASRNMVVCAAFGGLAKHQQIKELKAGAEVAVCTPGRIIDLIRSKACDMGRVTYVVLDEADRMFDMGFEPQIRSLLGQIRPDRQTILFSATMPKKVQRLAADVLTSPIRITVGPSVSGSASGNRVGGLATAANADIAQKVLVLRSEEDKKQWLFANLPKFVDEGEVIVFANQKAKVEELGAELQAKGVLAKIGCMHGDLSQADRMHILHRFRQGHIHVLIGTDVASRGLDIKTINTVVNYEPAKDVDTHIHRIGRTGRAGDKEGVAVTLLLPHEKRAAYDLRKCLQSSGKEVPKALLHMTGGGGGGGGDGGWSKGGKNTGLSGFQQQQQQQKNENYSKFEEPSRQTNHSGSNTWVSSGVIGGGGGDGANAALKPEIIMPKRSAVVAGAIKTPSLPASTLPPPPIPVNQQPLYLQSKQKQQQSNNEQVQKAIERAREIAARLSAGRHPPPPPPPPPPS